MNMNVYIYTYLHIYMEIMHQPFKVIFKNKNWVLQVLRNDYLL